MEIGRNAKHSFTNEVNYVLLMDRDFHEFHHIQSHAGRELRSA